jgi:hypothetical protein
MQISQSRLLLLADVALESTELLVPMRLELIEPRLDLQYRLATQAEDAQARIARDALVRNEAGVEEDAQVAAHHRRGCTSGRSQLPGAVRPITEDLDDAPPRRVGERVEEPLHVVAHFSNSY